MSATLTGDVAQEVLVLHGRLRLLRGHRNREAQRLRGSVEQLHSMLLSTLKSLDSKQLSQPIDNLQFRKHYQAMRYSERRIMEIDLEASEVQSQIDGQDLNVC